MNKNEEYATETEEEKIKKLEVIEQMKSTRPIQKKNDLEMI